jgi:hypothetical protein
VNGSADPLPRRAVLHGILGGAALTLLACGTPTAATLDDTVAQLVERLEPDGPYRHPTPAERDRALAAVDRLTSADATGAADLFGRIGMQVSVGTDGATGRRHALAASRAGTDRSWGMLAIDLTSPPPEVVVEVPHPGSDRHTERLGLALFRALPRGALLIAGAHRRAARGTADVAHQPDSMFHALANHLAGHGASQLQLHGFHDDSLANHDIVISAGAGTPDRRTKQMADALTNADFDVCLAWTERCGSLEGSSNAQGLAAADRYPFLHLEINRSTREDPERTATLIHTLTAGYGSI